MPDHKSLEKQKLRLLKLLAKRSSKGFSFEVHDRKIGLHSDGRRHNFNQDLVDTLIADGHVLKSRTVLKLSAIGREFLERLLRLGSCQNGAAPGEISARVESQKVAFNKDESPLARLYNRKTKGGTPYISEEEYHAGERLRQDFEQGQLQPRVTANFNRAFAGSTNSGNRIASADITDFAIDARARISGALEILGPELGGVALDICCFLKGFELVERERCWPPRSAKLMLKTALSMLSGHYGLRSGEHRSNGEIKTWGSNDFRPSLGI